MAAEEKSGLEIDDWLDDLQNEKPEKEDQVAGAELDQSDIDSLLGGDAEKKAAAGAGDAAADAADLDQSDIDALLGGGPAEAPAAPVAAAGGQEDFAELDQSDIDSLLGGGGAVAAEKTAASELDQSDIDDLFAAAPAPGAAPTSAEMEGETGPSQEDVEQLFSDIDEAAGAETVGFTEVVEGEKEGGGEESFGLTEADLGDEDFGFDDNIPEIPDAGPAVAGPPAEAKKEDFFADEATAQELADYLKEGTVAAAAGKEGPRREEKKVTLPLPIAMNKTIMVATAVCVVLLVGGFGYFFLKGEKKEPAVPVIQEQQAAAPASPPVEVAANRIPVVEDGQYQLDEAVGAVCLHLSGKDEDNDPLKFEIISPPKYGRLSGDLPDLTYLPNKDFPGEDSFEFKASDGKDTSSLARVTIKGPVLAKAKTEEPKAARVRKKAGAMVAKEVRLETLSTEPLIIDWQKIWQKTNQAPYPAKAGVEILTEDFHGTLARISPSKHKYTPDKFFEGTEIIKYRFKHGKTRSKSRQLLVSVRMGDLVPEIHLKPLAEAYPVGTSVMVDASQTRDDAPHSLVYSWEQVFGVPVQLDALNEEGSIVSFVVPSSFYTEGAQQTILKVTAMDKGGQRASENIVVRSVSRYNSALWRGAPSGTIPPEPSSPKGDHQDRLLP